MELLKDTTIPEPDNLFDTYEGKGKYSNELRMSMEHLNKTDLKGEVIPANLTHDEKRSWAYQRYIKDYLRCVAGIDENVGRILKYLDDNGLTENTIVIYTSDQGFFLGEHGWFDKRMIYEECTGMPFLIRYPKEIKPGTVNNDIILNLDFASTFLDFAGIATPSYMQGESFRSNLTGKTPPDWRKAMYYRYWMNNDNPHHVPAHYGIRTERYKLAYFYELPLGMNGASQYQNLEPEWELYDLQKDPAEMRNIYKDPANKKLIIQLKEELLQLKEKYDDSDSKYPEMVEINKKYWR
jgi:arylsulfatase A-like enzyme